MGVLRRRSFHVAHLHRCNQRNRTIERDQLRELAGLMRCGTQMKYGLKTVIAIYIYYHFYLIILYHFLIFVKNYSQNWVHPITIFFFKCCSQLQLKLLSSWLEGREIEFYTGRKETLDPSCVQMFKMKNVTALL